MQLAQGRVPQVVARQPRGWRFLLQVVERSPGTRVERSLHALCLGHRDRTVEPMQRRGVEANEHVVEPHDVDPVGLGVRRCAAVLGEDRGFDVIAPDLGTFARAVQIADRFADLGPVPALARLLFEQQDRAVVIVSGIAARVMQRHQGQQRPGRADRAPRVGEQHATQPQRLLAQLQTQVLVLLDRAVALVEQQVDDALHALQALGERLGAGPVEVG